MFTIPRAVAAVSTAALVAALAVYVLTANRQADAPTPPQIQPGPALDEPDAAAQFAAMKRRGRTRDHEPAAAYELARARIESMPLYSTRLGAYVTPRSDTGAHSNRKSVNIRPLDRWTPVGPGNIGGRTRTLVIHPDDPDIMYAGGVSGGVWKTVDGGHSWLPIADELSNIAVNSMVLDPDDPETLYVGTGEGYFREIVRGTWLPLRGAGIYRSTDGGASWERLPSTTGADFHWVNDLIISPLYPDHIYAATRTGVHFSENGGRTWTRILVPEVNGGCLDLAIRTDLSVPRIFASCGTFEQATVYRIREIGGASFEPVLSQPGMGRTSLAIAPSSPNVIYALAASNVPGPGGHYEQALQAVYRSNAGGDPGSWQVRVDNTNAEKLNTLLLTNPAGASYEECGWGEQNSWTPMGWYCNVIAVDPVDPNTVWAAGVDLFRSDDGGRNWGLASYWWGRSEPGFPSFAHADQHTVVFHPDYDGVTNTTMFAANDGGVFRTDNPAASIGHDEGAICDPTRSEIEFTPLNHNLGITQFYHGAPFPDGNAYLGGTQDNGTIMGAAEWGSDGWISILGGDGGYVAVDPTNPSIIYAESQRFGFRKSVNGGAEFSEAVAGITEPPWDFLFVTPFAMDPNDPQRLWTGGRRVWRTDDGAELWVPASPNPLGSGQVSALAVDPGNSQSVLVGTTDGFVYRSTSALSANSSTSWESSRPREGFVTSMAFDPSSPGVVYATFAEFGGNHVWRSADTGVTWEPIDGGGAASIPDIPVHCLVVDPENPRRLYLGTDLGVFTSLNGGATWSVENTGFASVVTEWLAVGFDTDGTPSLYAFTHGRGAWKVGLRPTPPEPLRPSARRQPEP